MNNNPIGIFDSGVGGLSVARQIRELMPHEHILYLADSAFAPYGNKSVSFITQRCGDIVRFLMAQNAKAVVVACNTATTSSIHELRQTFSIPIIGVEPGIKPAVLTTKTGIVGVMATQPTVNSDSFNLLVKRICGDVKAVLQACPGLVERIEAMQLDDDTTRTLVSKYVLSLVEQGVDKIVLGCTHYTFLSPLIHKIAGSDIGLISTEAAVAKETQRRLSALGLINETAMPGADEFWTSGSEEKARQQISFYWGQSVQVRKMPLGKPHSD